MSVNADIKALKCPKCDGQLDVDGTKESVKCPFCGTVYSTAELLKESDEYRIEKMRTQAFKEVETERMKREDAAEKKREEKEAVAAFKKGKFSKVLIIFAVLGALFCCLSFSNGKILAGLVAIIMTALFLASWLMGMRIVDEPKKGVRILAAIVAFVLLIPYVSLQNKEKVISEKIDWDELELGDMIPEPKSNKGRVYSDSSDSLSVEIHKVSEDEYDDYIEKCKEKGFNVEADKGSSTFSAYDVDGYELSLSYFDSNKEMSIHLNAPKEMSEFKWPSSDIAKLLPVPKSNIGSVSYDNSDGFFIYVGNTSEAEYKAYVEACADKGFTVDYDKGDTYYYADDKDGNHVSVVYEGNNIMYVTAEKADEEEIAIPEPEKVPEPVIPEPSKEPETAPENVTSEPEIKKEPEQEVKVEIPAEDKPKETENSIGWEEFLDEYEDWVDEYIAFMKKYTDNPMDLSLLADYGKLMAEYSDWASKTADFSDDLSDADALKYIDRLNKINIKLASAGL